MIYRFEKRARRPTTLLVLGSVWLLVALLWLGLDLAPLIALVLVGFTLPALWDVIRDSRGTVEVWSGRIVWSSTLGSGDRSDVDHVRFNRRFDGGMRVTLVHVGGATTRLPPDIGAPVAAFEDALRTAGIATQRHPFFPI